MSQNLVALHFSRLITIIYYCLVWWNSFKKSQSVNSYVFIRSAILCKMENSTELFEVTSKFLSDENATTIESTIFGSSTSTVTNSPIEDNRVEISEETLRLILVCKYSRVSQQIIKSSTNRYRLWVDKSCDSKCDELVIAETFEM